MKYQYVIWDVDGTLLDTREGLISAYKWFFEQWNMSPLSDDDILKLIGPTPVTIFTEHFGFSLDDARKASDLFRTRYKEHDLFKGKFYDGIVSVLETFQKMGMKQAVATNKRSDYAVLICQHFGIDKFCSPIHGADNENKLTKADLIQKCLTDLKCNDLSKAIMIGDTVGDKVAAEKAGIDFIGVNYGFGFKGIDKYANIPTDLIDNFVK